MTAVDLDSLGAIRPPPARGDDKPPADEHNPGREQGSCVVDGSTYLDGGQANPPDGLALSCRPASQTIGNADGRESATGIRLSGRVSLTSVRVSVASSLQSLNELRLAVNESISRIISKQFTQVTDEPDDESMYGCVLVVHGDVQMQSIGSGASQGISSQANDRQGERWTRLAAIALYYPCHAMLELRHLLLPMCSALFATTCVYLVAREQLQKLGSHYEGTLASLDQASGTESITDLVLDILPWFMTGPMSWISLSTEILTFWHWATVKHAFVRRGLPLSALSTLVYLLEQWFKEALGSMSSYLPPLRLLLFVACWIFFFSGIAKATSNPAFNKYPLMLLLYSLIMIVYLTSGFIAALAKSPDYVKALVAGFVNPLVFEIVLMTPSRFFARSLRHNHPSTSFLLVANAIVAKQVVGRSVAILVRDVNWQWILAINGSLAEFTFRITLRSRDAAMYRLIFKHFLAKEEDATAALKHPRNSFMRANNSMLESIGEYVAIWNAVFLVLLFKVSLDGKSVVSAWAAIRSGAIQSFMEFITDMFSIGALYVLFGIDILQRAADRVWYWSLPIIPLFLYTYTVNLFTFLGFVLCAKPGLDGADYTMCGM